MAAEEALKNYMEAISKRLIFAGRGCIWVEGGKWGRKPSIVADQVRTKRTSREGSWPRFGYNT